MLFALLSQQIKKIIMYEMEKKKTVKPQLFVMQITHFALIYYILFQFVVAIVVFIQYYNFIFYLFFVKEMLLAL